MAPWPTSADYHVVLVGRGATSPRSAQLKRLGPADGEHALGEFSFNEFPAESHYRVVFYIHSWNQRLPLLSSYGPLKLPPAIAMPPRLWRLAPYEQVD
jgi:hypothetical protein